MPLCGPITFDPTVTMDPPHVECETVSSLLPKSLKNSLQNLPKLALRLRLIRGITPLIRNRNWIDILPSANLYANLYHNAQT